MINNAIHYDFILFENQFAYEFHYKDLANLAILLKEAGYSVAIADVFKEDSLCQIDGIPHISFQKKAPKYFTDLKNSIEKKSPWKRLLLRIQQGLYLRYVLKTITSLCDRIYLGALVYNTPFSIWSLFKNDKQYYFWGLRSYIVLQWRQTGLLNATGMISRLFYGLVHKYGNVSFFCSNDAIKNEFLENANVGAKRLIVRPERFVSEITLPIVRHDCKLRLLSIGSTRRTKNIHRIIDALKIANNPNIIYTIAGANLYEDEYETVIKEKMEGMSNVIRIDRVLTDQEFEDCLDACDFLVTCEGKQATNISSGTLSDALLHGKPVIGPNHNTYYDEINGYGVGIIYDFDDIHSLADAMNQAYSQGVTPFVDNLIAYQQKF